MAWRRLGLVVAAAVWASGCGSSSDDDDLVSPGFGGFGEGGVAGFAGSSTAGFGGTNVGGAAGGGGGGGFIIGGAAGAAANGGTAGAAGGGAAGTSGAAGAAGNPTVCPGVQPKSGGACSLSTEDLCTYASGPSCGPGSVYTICQCTDAAAWNCVTAKDTPCSDTCNGPVAAGQSCENEGAACSDACSNACKCSDGQWFCNGQCTDPPPTKCSTGAECKPGDECKEATPDGCVTYCSCTQDGLYACKSDCSSTCAVDSAVCGGSCSTIGQSCTCFGKDGAVPCTCDFGPTDAPVWMCETPSTGCEQGALCKPGQSCGSAPGPDGCSTSCSCGKGGTYDCTTSCSVSCPDTPALCGQPCMAVPDAVCKCVGKEGEAQPCSCENGAWACTTTPVDPCTPGAKCTPGDACKDVQDDGCVLSCQCSKGGLYQCKSDCPDPAACPAMTPTPGDKCSDPGLSCSYGVFTVCSCGKDGTWSCAL